jgi:non-ribosomal peptide synthetase component F
MSVGRGPSEVSGFRAAKPRSWLDGADPRFFGASNEQDFVVTPSAASSFNLAEHCLGRQAADRGAKTALILCDGRDAFRSWTYGELDLEVRKLASGLIESGLKKGDRVMIRAEDDIGFVLAFFATVASAASRSRRRLS